MVVATRVSAQVAAPAPATGTAQTPAAQTSQAQASDAQAPATQTLGAQTPATPTHDERALAEQPPSAIGTAASGTITAPSPAETARAGAPIPPGPAERWVDARRVDRLESALFELAQSDATVRHWGGVGALIVGGVLIVSGVLVAADEGWGGRGRIAVSAGAWASGASLIAAGIYRWFTTTPAEDRFARWNELRVARKLDVFEFARIEGELASEAESARFSRRLSAFSSFGIVAGGVGLITLAASDEIEGSLETDTYVLGGVLAGVGALQAATLLMQRMPAEKAWQHYTEGGGGLLSTLRMPEASRPRLSF